ncbi:UNVERIFIED_ORG: hypothetical protein B2H93_18270 [Clostridium botulinum]|nr:hypothetical protein [Clostridium botulinum]
MALLRLCSICGNKVPYGSKCKCEIDNMKSRYKSYKYNRKDIKEQQFYSSKDWIKCRNNISTHQFGLDIIEWNKGKTINAERYHHIIETKEEWSLRLDENNIIGLTQKNHRRIHILMNKSEKDKRNIQEWLKKLLNKFEIEYYDTPGSHDERI